MAHYLLTVNDVPINNNATMKAEVIINSLFTHNTWIFREGAPLLKRLKIGDKAMIYVCGPNRRYFMAEIIFLDEVKSFSGNTKLAKLVENLGLVWMSLSVEIEVTKLFRKPVDIRPLIPSLSFIVDKKNFGLNLRQSIISIPEHDYELIAKHAV